MSSHIDRAQDLGVCVLWAPWYCYFQRVLEKSVRRRQQGSSQLIATITEQMGLIEGRRNQKMTSRFLKELLLDGLAS